MKTEGLFQRLREYDLPKGKYALSGSAPMYVRGLRDYCNDIDVIVTEDVWDDYSKREGWETRDIPYGSEYLWNRGIELWKDWTPENWDIQKLIQEAEIIQGLPFVRLEYVLESKKRHGRKKDKLDVKIIKKFLKLK